MASHARRALRLGGVLAAAAAVLTGGPAASASDLVTRDARGPRIQVNAKGVALVTYERAEGGGAHVLYWGAINDDLKFSYDRSGGWKSGKADWRHFRDACRPYSGPKLFAVVDACTAPDGSHWALQVWSRIRPIGSESGRKELRISHWTGSTGELWTKSDWSWRGRSRHVYGRLTWRGKGVFAKKVRRDGYVLDGRGRNIGLLSLDSDYGSGWRYVNGFLTNRPSGQFCYGLNRKHTPTGRTGTGVSSVGRYRAQVAGPYVTPDLMVEFTHPEGSYDAAFDAQANRVQLDLLEGLRLGSCWPVN